MLLIQGAKVIRCRDSRKGEGSVARVLGILEGLDTSGSRAPGATTAATAALRGASGVFGHVGAASAGVCSVCGAVAAHSASLFGCHIFWHLTSVVALSQSKVRVVSSAAPFALAALAALRVFGAHRIAAGALRISSLALPERVSGSGHTCALAPRATTVPALILLRALALVRCDGHGIAAGTRVLVALATEAAKSTLLRLPLILQLGLIHLGHGLLPFIILTGVIHLLIRLHQSGG
mmetsp:Transcript_67914/g.162109  ORF Transcript_67914/g.162109 Transcript_67914/m.162109 type:complete len:236 (-) Transcript_67914:351-1058(-)